MPLNRNQLKKLASLSAVGAGAIALTADQAEASIIHVTVNQPVGFSAGSGATFSSLLALSNSFRFKRASNHRTLHSYGGTTFLHTRLIQESGFGVQFAEHLNQLKIFSSGQSWNGAFGGANQVATRQWGTYNNGAHLHQTFGVGSFTDKYALFEFNPGGGTLHGWLELSSTVSNAHGPD